ncbi:MAG: VOC family protein, partial [Henriciella sp.]|uniref:VOC family protein n=1 Tax=Henriciella sp. TaxID=1968823 RepID=UPI003C71EAB3
MTALDHAVLICPDITDGIAAYTSLLGARPVWQNTADGIAMALFQTANTALELVAPDGEGAAADRLRSLLDETGPRLTSLAFRADDT